MTDDRVCSLCLRRVEEPVLDHFEENHPNSDLFQRWKTWSEEQPQCRGCPKRIPFERTLTEDGIHLAPSYCENCQSGLLKMVVRKMGGGDL